MSWSKVKTASEFSVKCIKDFRSLKKGLYYRLFVVTFKSGKQIDGIISTDGEDYLTIRLTIINDLGKRSEFFDIFECPFKAIRKDIINEIFR